MSQVTSATIRNVPAAQAWERLKNDPRAQLVDVRTKAEWSFVGVPELSAIGREVILIEWQTYPQGATAPDFVERCAAALARAGAGHEDEIYFLCRSGARSLSAARAVAATGFVNCINVEEGFEGPLDEHRRRGVQGWKAAGLPWIQS